jgi:hypothetical protein
MVWLASFQPNKQEEFKMIFQADIAFALSLIAIGVGYWVLNKSKSMEDTGLKTTGKFLGYFITIAAILTLLCTSYYSLKYWEDGSFQARSGQMCMNHGGGMMGNMMSGHGGMMMGMMGGCDKSMMSGDQGDCKSMGAMGSGCSRMMKKGKMSGHMKGMMKDGEKSMMKMDGGMMDRSEYEDEDSDQ